jgi:cyanophycin synthetase
MSRAWWRRFDLREEVQLGPSTAAIVEEAHRRGIPVRRLNSRMLVQLGLGRNLRRIQAAMSDFTSAIAVEIAQDKDDTRRVLESVGLPVPSGSTAPNLCWRRSEIAAEIGYPVLLKPLDASHGRGISGTARHDADAVARAWPVAASTAPASWSSASRGGATTACWWWTVGWSRSRSGSPRTWWEMAGAACGAHRGGQPRPARGTGHTKVLTRLPLDVTNGGVPRHHRAHAEAFPDPGEIVPLRATANLSTGGTAVDRTDEIHPDNVTACEMAAGIVGLDIAGIDVLTTDISVPFRENGAVIIEVNAAPGCGCTLTRARACRGTWAARSWTCSTRRGPSATIPVIAVTGTNGKTTTVRLIAHLFRQTGKVVGFTTTDGVYLQDRLVMEGDMTGPFSANIVLSNPTVEVAVLETARGGILRAGLGFR